MPNAFTGGASGAAWDLLVETAFDRAVEYYLRDEPQWRQVIDKRPGYQAMPGDVVTLSLHNAITPLATTPLTETVDPDAIAAPAPTRVQVTLNEWGASTLTTFRLRNLSFTQPEAEMVELVGRHQQDTIDALIRAVADAGTNILWVNGGNPVTSGGANGSVVSTDILTRKPAVIAPKLLRRAKVSPKQANMYVAMVHPDVTFDLQAENAATAWVGPHTYGTDTANIYSGVTGDFQGARYIETTRVTQTTDGGSGTHVYSSYYFGRQALVEASVSEPHTVVGNQTDKLKRFYPVGWLALAGWAIYRPQALVTVRTASSIGAL